MLSGTGAIAAARSTMDVANVVLLRRARKATVSLNMVQVDEASSEDSLRIAGLIYGSGMFFSVDSEVNLVHPLAAYPPRKYPESLFVPC